MKSPRPGAEEQEEEGEAGVMQKDGFLLNSHRSTGESRCLGSPRTLPHPSLGHALPRPSYHAFERLITQSDAGEAIN